MSDHDETPTAPDAEMAIVGCIFARPDVLADVQAVGGDIDVAMSALEKAAKIAPHSAETMQQLAGAMIDLGKAAGDGSTAKGLELLIGMGQASRVKDWAQLGANAPRGVIGAAGNGMSAEGGAALFETYTNAMADKEGAVSATAAQNLAARMRAFLPEKDVYDTDPATGKRRLMARGVGAMTGEQRLERISNDPALREQFLNRLDNSESKAATELLLTPGTAPNKFLQSRMKEYQAGRGVVTAESFADVLNNPELQKTAAMDRAFNQILEKGELNNVGGSRASIIGEKLNQTQFQTGRWFGGRAMDSTIYNVKTMMGYEPEAAAISLLRSQAISKLSNEGRLSGKELTQAEVNRRIETETGSLGEVIKELKGIRANQRTGNNSRQHTEGH